MALASIASEMDRVLPALELGFAQLAWKVDDAGERGPQ
jgi:hypothetical protein